MELSDHTNPRAFTQFSSASVSLSYCQPVVVLPFHSMACAAVLSASVSCTKDKISRACQKEAALIIVVLHYPGQAGLLTHHL